MCVIESEWYQIMVIMVRTIVHFGMSSDLSKCKTKVASDLTNEYPGCEPTFFRKVFSFVHIYIIVTIDLTIDLAISQNLNHQNHRSSVFLLILHNDIFDSKPMIFGMSLELSHHYEIIFRLGEFESLF